MYQAFKIEKWVSLAEHLGQALLVAFLSTWSQLSSKEETLKTPAHCVNLPGTSQKFCILPITSYLNNACLM